MAGRILERPASDRSVGHIAAYISARAVHSHLRVVIRPRLEVAPGQFDKPDICLVHGDQDVPINLPFLCVKVISPESRWTATHREVTNLRQMGIPYVWVINPQAKSGFISTDEGFREAKDGMLRTKNPALEIPLSEFFS